ncbi:O-methyltransferase [Microdochium nivale]|nr:O-methyltransferase [Microdochium nivale]
MSQVQNLRRMESTSSAGTGMTEKEEILFARLYVQAQDASSPSPVLGDPYAQQYVNKADLNFQRKIFITDPRTVRAFSSRNKLHDEWVQHFLDIHALAQTPVTIFQLGCALDSRNVRINRGSSVRWIDADTEDVINFRRRIIPTPPGDYTLMSVDMTQTSWLDSIPADRPTYIISEEVWMWQKPQQGKNLIRALVNHFPCGQLAADTVGSIIKDLSWLMPFFKGTSVKFEWAINSGRELEVLDPRLKLNQEMLWLDVVAAAVQNSEVADLFGRWTSLASLIPGFKNCSQVILLDYGLLPTSRSTMSSSATQRSGLSDTSVTGVSHKGSSISVRSGLTFSSKRRYIPGASRSSTSKN